MSLTFLNALWLWILSHTKLQAVTLPYPEAGKTKNKKQLTADPQPPLWPALKHADRICQNTKTTGERDSEGPLGQSRRTQMLQDPFHLDVIKT